ncbi:hypothetical protein [Pedobacter africanus]|uniref:Uncharacterized protein n=1 Tax=Pedobacter africanus TaxID=151894 RepID=A0A1W2B0Q5_9SPHI|nr:hypothetical protein [Pedobacter africanus]SMC66302.1 hypothetical protein SAMN04488524_1813 [Pedobacter africanus]
MKKDNVPMFKRTSFFFTISCLFVLLVSIYACRKTLGDNAAEYSKKGYSTEHHKIDYNSSVSDSVLNFSVQVYKRSDNTKEIDEIFEIDLKKVSFSKDVYEALADKADKSEYNNLSTAEIKMICKSIKMMIQESTRSLNPVEVKDPKIQGLYMSLSFVRRILSNKLGLSQNLKATHSRSGKHLSSVNNDSDDPEEQDYPSYEQDVFEGYNLGLSSFALNEDIIVNKPLLQAIISQDLISASSDNRGLYVFQDVLETMNSSTFTLKDLLAAFDVYRNSHPELNSFVGWWPRGSSHGCCGNYSGACYYWHPICYVHDKICKKCTPSWFCFSGCVPDADAEDNKPFTFVEDSIDTNTIVLTIPTPVPPFAYYLTNLSQYDPELEPADTSLYYNANDGKYYSDTQYLNVLTDAYYFVDNYATGKYYKIVGGKVVKVGFVSAP